MENDLDLVLKLIQANDITQLRRLLHENKELVLQRTSWGILPIHYALREKKWNIVGLLSEIHPEGLVEPDVGTGSYILHRSLELCVGTDIVLKIVEANASSLQCVDCLDGSLPLHKALQSGYRNKVIKPMVHLYPQALHVADTTDGSLPIHVALRNDCSSDVLQLLATENPDSLLEKDLDGCLPIHIALEKKASLEKIKVLGDLKRSSLQIRDGLDCLPLHLACMKHSWSVAEYLITQYPEAVIFEDFGGDLPLHLACAGQAWRVAELIVEHRPECAKQRDSCNRLPISVALSGKSWRTVEKLLLAHPEGSQVADDFFTLPLHAAIENEQWKLAMQILKLFPPGARRVDKANRSPLTLAAKHGAPHIVVAALCTVLKDDIQTEDTNYVDIALRYGHWKTSVYLVKQMSKLAQARNRHNKLPIQVAIMQCAPDYVLHALCEAHPEAALNTDDQGNSLGHAAVLSRHWILLDCLLQFCPSVACQRNRNNELLLDLAMKILAPSHVVVAIFLASPQICNMEGSWMFREVLKKYQLQSKDMKQLATSRALISYVDGRGNTALHVAIELGLVDVVNALLDAGMNVFTSNEEGQTPLDLGQINKMKRPEISMMLSREALLKRPGWLQASDHMHRTPLFHAVQAGEKELVLRMLEIGANPCILDQAGQTVVDFIPCTNDWMKIHLIIAKNTDHRIVLQDRYALPLVITEFKEETNCFLALDMTQGAYVMCHMFRELLSWQLASKRSGLLKESPYIVKLLDSFRRDMDDSPAYFVVTTGGTTLLQEDIEMANGTGMFRRSLAETVSSAQGLIRAVFSLHAKSHVVHSHLTPSCFIRDNTFVYKFCKVTEVMNEGAQFDSTFLTIDSYTAPEIARAQTNHELMLGKASMDIWSLGCIIFELFTTSPLLSDENNLSMHDKLLSFTQNEVDRILSKCNLLPSVDRLLRRMLRVDPMERWPVAHLLQKCDFFGSFCTSEESVASNAFHLTKSPFSTSEMIALTFQQQKKEMKTILSVQAEQNRQAKRIIESMNKGMNRIKAVDAIFPHDVRDDVVFNDFKASCESDEQHSFPQPEITEVSLIGREVEKEFDDGEIYAGHVISVREVDTEGIISKCWLVKYEDGDEEELDERELNGILLPMKNHSTTNATKVDSSNNNAAFVSEPASDLSTQLPSSLIGREIEKKFDDGICYQGKVVGHRRSAEGIAWYEIRYEDGDSEEVEQEELDQILIVRNPQGPENSTSSVRNKPSRRKARGRSITSRQEVDLGDEVWLLHDKKLIARGRVIIEPDEVAIHSNKLCVHIFKYYSDAPSEFITQLTSSPHRHILQWPIVSCLKPQQPENHQD